MREQTTYQLKEQNREKEILQSVFALIYYYIVIIDGSVIYSQMGPKC